VFCCVFPIQDSPKPDRIVKWDQQSFTEARSGGTVSIAHRPFAHRPFAHCPLRKTVLNALLIAGSDFGVGKTVLVSVLAAYWQRYLGARSLGMMKPIDCGTGDAQRFQQQFFLEQSPEQTNPIRFEAKLPAPIAALRENQRVELEKMWRSFESLSQQKEFVLLEGLGGLGSPITEEMTVADLAWDWRIPIVLVVPVQRGAIAQAVANVALANQARIHLKGIVLNCVQPCHAQEIEDWTSADLLQSLTQKPVLGCIPHLSNPTDSSKLAQVASQLHIERLLPGSVV
jgi:dethiobiotin synthetase